MSVPSSSSATSLFSHSGFSHCGFAGFFEKFEGFEGRVGFMSLMPLEDEGPIEPRTRPMLLPKVARRGGGFPAAMASETGVALLGAAEVSLIMISLVEGVDVGLPQLGKRKIKARGRREVSDELAVA